MLQPSLRPLPISRIVITFSLTVVLGVGALAATVSTRSKTGSMRHKATAATHAADHDVKPAQPAAPKSVAELQQELASTFQSGRFAKDSVQVQVEPQKIVLTGTVHGAEDKGLATSQSRLIARKGGWDNVHVLNRLQVSLPQSW